MFTPPSDRIIGKRVNFMATCLCDAMFDNAGKDAYRLLSKYVERVEFPQGQTCCGQPAFNSGDFESARRVIRSTMKAFSDNDLPIITPSASCAAMLFHSAKIAFANESQKERDEVENFSKRVWELCDYLVNALDIQSVGGNYAAKIAVHNSCHSFGTGTPEAMRKLLLSIKGIELLDFDDSDNCCGFGGTFSVVFPQISSELGERKVRAIAAVNPNFVVSADTSCLMHQCGIAKRLKIAYPAKHVAQILCSAIQNGGLV